MYYTSVGSISSGTLRPEDLCQAYLDTLDNIKDCLVTEGDAPLKPQIVAIDNLCAKVEQNREYFGTEYDDDGWPDDEEALVSLLEAYAPPLCYFGGHPGDGADIGYWQCEDWQESDEVLTVSAGDEWPEIPDGIEYVAEVTDHGNVTLYDLNHKEIWSLV